MVGVIINGAVFSGLAGVIIIAVVFTGLAGGIFWAGTHGGLGGLTNVIQTQTSLGRRAITVTLVVVYAGFGIAVPIVFILGNRDRASAQVNGIKLTSSEKQGRILFGEHCAVCHTLSAAAAVGKVGPNLDQVKPSKELVLHTIANGCLESPGAQNPNQVCLGYGTMPASVVQGQDAQEVAAFVSAVTGGGS